MSGSCMSVRIFSACGLGDAGQNNRRTVGEFSDERHVAPHGLDGVPESG